MKTESNRDETESSRDVSDKKVYFLFNFRASQGLELQHVRRRNSTLRPWIVNKSREMVSSMVLFESICFHLVRHRFRQSFRRTKTKNFSSHAHSGKFYFSPTRKHFDKERLRVSCTIFESSD